MNTVSIAFESGFIMVTSGNALKKKEIDMGKLKCGEIYYAVLEERDMCVNHVIAVVVFIKYTDRVLRDSAEVYQKTWGGRKNRMTVRTSHIGPYNNESGSNLLHNMKIHASRIRENTWRFGINHKTAKKIVLEALAALSKKKRKNIMDVLKKGRPDLIKPDGSLKVSKIKMTLWSELAWGIICERYPLKKVWPQERK